MTELVNSKRYALLVACLMSMPAYAAKNESDHPYVKLRNHEPNFLGYTWDRGDESFMDFTLSLQHPVFHPITLQTYGCMAPYLAFTGRFGQYLDSVNRGSSPVIAKRYNPKVFIRLAPITRPGTSQHGKVCRDPEEPANSVFGGKSPDKYMDFEYAHESNGQSVNSAATFQATTQSVGGNPENATDYISRGWDYLGIAVKHPIGKSSDGTGWFVYLSRKWYCGCVLQDDIEQIHDFEEPREITSIKQVSGWQVTFKYDGKDDVVERLAFILDTGVRDSFKYNTLRAEVSFGFITKILRVPLVFWARTGYLPDLAQYYERGESLGVAFLFETF